MQIAMSALVLAAGLMIAVVLDAPAEMKIFGYAVTAVGALGLIAALLMRRP